ncbi:MAG: nitroreductase family protein [Cloacibacillus sp.]
MKNILMITALFILTFSTAACAANIILPEPDKTGGPSVLEAIANRASAAQEPFAKQELSMKELSTVLWAATGKNREPKGWTVPMAMGREPYVTVYVILKNGGYIYNWEKNALIEVIAEKRLISRAVTQDFAKTAPCLLVLVNRGTMNVEQYSDIAAGAMAQNVYLAAEALNLKTRFLASFNKVSLESSLMLGPIMKIAGVMVVGRQ